VLFGTIGAVLYLRTLTHRERARLARLIAEPLRGKFLVAAVYGCIVCVHSTLRLGEELINLLLFRCEDLLNNRFETRIVAKRIEQGIHLDES